VQCGTGDSCDFNTHTHTHLHDMCLSVKCPFSCDTSAIKISPFQTLRNSSQYKVLVDKEKRTSQFYRGHLHCFFLRFPHFFILWKTPKNCIPIDSSLSGTVGPELHICFLLVEGDEEINNRILPLLAGKVRFRGGVRTPPRGSAAGEAFYITSVVSCSLLTISCRHWVIGFG